MVLFVALLPLSACSDDETVDPQTVLGRSAAAMSTVRGFHFVYEVHKPGSARPASGLEIARITGDVNSEGSMQATIDVTSGGIPLQLEFVVVEDIQYLLDPLSRKWQSVATAKSPVGELNLGQGVVGILERIMDATYSGRDDKQGVPCHHIAGRAAAEDVNAIAGAVSTTDDFPTNIWVGVEDGLVYQVDIAGAATPNEPADIRRSIILSNLDEYVDIEAPR